MKFLAWLIDTYFPDRWVPREDFDAVQNREFPVMAREMEQLRQHRDALQLENQKLICDGLHHHRFLPKCADDRGTLDTELTIRRNRQNFTTTVSLTVADTEIRWVEDRLRPQVFEYLARILAAFAKRELLRKFEPPYPGDKG
jgi:hypothetical protein